MDEVESYLMEAEKVEFEDITGVGRVTAGKLRDAGIYSMKHLALHTTDELVDLVGVDPLRLSKMLIEARKLLGIKTFDGLQYSKFRQGLSRLTTGLAGFDELLGGGLEPRGIYELAGEFGVGKTQLACQLTITSQMSTDRGGVNGSSYFIDTEGTFSPERIRKIAERFEMDPDLVLSNIYAIEAINVDHQVEALRTEAVRHIEENNVKLILVDSLIGHFRAEYAGREKLAPRQQRLNYFIDWLMRIAKVYKIFAVVTNQVMDVPVPWKTADKRPTGGNIVAHGMTHRFMLSNAGKNRRGLKVIDSPKLPYGAETYFEIYDGGVRDA